MKNTIGKKILIFILMPFSILFGALLVFVLYSVSEYVTNWTQLELKGISEINAADLEGRVYSVRISVLSAADVLNKLDKDSADSRGKAEKILQSMFENEYIYNAWLACEPDAFDGKDAEHTDGYPGAPSGRFIRSYVMEDGEIVTSPDMDEETLDDIDISPWYVIPRDTGVLYIDVDNDLPNLYDYGLGGEPVYTLSIAAPIYKDGRVIGCVGADVRFDVTTFGIGSKKEAAVAVFYPNGRIFYSLDLAYAEESVSTLGFSEVSRITEAMSNGESLFLPKEYSIFLNTYAFTYFQPVKGSGESGSLYLYTALPRGSVFADMRSVFILIAIIAVTIPILVVSMFVYMTLKISKPLKSLTLAANAISQGDLETEIASFEGADGEIGILSQSLHRMVEQFRVCIINTEQSREEVAVFTQLDGLFKTNNAESIFSALSGVLCRHFNMCRVTFVRADDGRARILATYDIDKTVNNVMVSPAPDFLFHPQVLSLVSGKNIVFMNSFAIGHLKAAFLDETTASACIVPVKNASLLGYIVMENKEKLNFVNANTETIMLNIASRIADWWESNAPSEDKKTTDAAVYPLTDTAIHLPEDTEIYPYKDESTDNTPESDLPPSVGYKGIEEIDSDAAIEVMGGLTEVYEQSLRLLNRLLPETLGKLDKYLAEDMRLFTIEIHGLKGSLNNIGAYTLGGEASRMEHAAKSDDADFCRENFPQFRTAVEALHVKLSDVLECETKIISGDKTALAEALQTAETMALDFDALDALEQIRPFTSYLFDGGISPLLENIIAALEIFDCEQAVRDIRALKSKL